MARRAEDARTQQPVDLDDQYAERRRTDVTTDGNGSAIAALVVGLLATTLGFLVVPALGAILLGLAAVILGAVGFGKANRLGGLHKGLAVTGILTGLLGLILGIAVVVGGINLFNQAEDEVQSNDEIQQRIDELESELREVSGG